MITIEYNKKGIAISDHAVNDYILSLSKNEKVVVSTENVIHAAILLYLDGKIDKPKFMFEGKEVIVNKYGAIHQWPDGFSDFQMNCVTKTLRHQINLQKKNRENPV